jgi:predicted RNA-binding Zn-ribbon protein involved in translation (DUF1610 family)
LTSPLDLLSGVERAPQVATRGVGRPSAKCGRPRKGSLPHEPVACLPSRRSLAERCNLKQRARNPSGSEMKSCPYCAEQIQDAASVCRYCSRAVVAPALASVVAGHDAIQHRITLARPRTGVLGAVSLLYGIFGLCVAFIFGVSLIGLPLAFLMGIGSMGFIAIGRGGARFACPHCGEKLVAQKNAENVRCAKCKNRSIIEWTNDSPPQSADAPSHLR